MAGYFLYLFVLWCCLVVMEGVVGATVDVNLEGKRGLKDEGEMSRRGGGE